MNLDQFLKALALTESNDNPNAPLGDGGRALGRFQTHPDWIWNYSHRYSISPNLNETWDSFISRIVAAFYSANCHCSPVIIAMLFHIGHFVPEGSPDWDAPYAERFLAHANNLV